MRTEYSGREKSSSYFLKVKATIMRDYTLFEDEL